MHDGMFFHYPFLRTTLMTTYMACLEKSPNGSNKIHQLFARIPYYLFPKIPKNMIQVIPRKTYHRVPLQQI